MSKFEIKMPKLGESITEGTILSWAVRVGDTVNEDDVLFEVNSAKVSAEIPSPVAGKVAEIRFKVGDTIAVGTVVALIETEGEGAEDAPTGSAPSGTEASQPETAPAAAASAEPTPKIPAETPTPEAPAPSAPTPPAAPVDKEKERWFSPVVLQLARESGIPQEELNALPGTGFEGRVTKRDVQQYLLHRQNGGTSAPRPDAAASAPVSAPVAAAPAAPAPVAAAAPSTPASVAASASAEARTAQSAAAPQADVEVREMDYVRKIIAEHMVLSKHTSPHVTSIVEADVTRLVKWREANKDDFFRKEGVKLTYMPAITEASAKALKAYPQVNVSVDGQNILYKKRIHIAMAVSLDDGNLITPVIHDADHLSLSGLAAAIDSLASKARGKKLKTEDLEGGTFTITNLGSFKTLIGTPIINQPQVAILGVGVIEKKPAVVETPEGDVIAIRHKMYLSLSYDHRVVDGALAGKFLYAVKEHLENWPL